MGTIVDLTVPENIADLLKRSEMSPDFSIMTDGMVSDPEKSNIVHMIGSSTERDLEGDTMSIHALNDMTKAPANLTVWLNHDYTLPDSIFGSIVGAPKIVHQGGVADLHLAVDVELDNPAAARVKRYIDNGRRLGCSIGCMVTKFEVPDEDDGEQWFQNPIIIHGVRVVEYSVVGVPANQRSWVENAIRGVFTRTLHPKLAPAMKSLWPRAYKEAFEAKERAEEACSYFEQQPARVSSGRRIDWYPEKKMFLFSAGDTNRFMAREEVQQYMAKDVQLIGAGDHFPTTIQHIDQNVNDIGTSFTTGNGTTKVHSPISVTSGTSTAFTVRANVFRPGLEYGEIKTVEQKDVVPDLVRTACGSTSLELDMTSSWDKGAAHARILEWAGGKDNFSKAKMKEVHFRVDGDGSNVTDYHLPFADIKNGHPVAIWHAIVAVAGALGGARGGLASEGDEGAIRSKVAHYYRKAGKTPPWQNEDKALNEIEAQKVEAQKVAGFAVNKDGTPGVSVDMHGNHDVFTGTHVHMVEVGGQLQLVEHTHEGTASHDHLEVETGYKPPVPSQGADPDGDGDIDTHPHSDEFEDQFGGQRQLSTDTDHIRTQLDIYNSFGKLLGLPEITEEKLKEFMPPQTHMGENPLDLNAILPEHVKKGMRAIHARTYAMTGGKVCSGFGSKGEHLTTPSQAPDGSHPTPLHPHHASHIQAIHDHAHAMSGADDNDGDVDDLKRALEIDMVKEMTDMGIGGPGNGGGAPGPAGLPEHVQKAVQAIHAHTYAMTGGKVCRGVGSDGQHLVSPAQAPDGSHPTPMHPDHAGHVQKMHDVIHTMTNGMACGMGSTTHYNETNFQDARQSLMDAEGQATSDMTGPQLRSFTEGVDRVTKALENVDVKALRKEVDTLKKEFQIARKGIQEIYTEISTAAATVAALKNMPLGNPIKQERTVTPSEAVTTHAELASLAKAQGTASLDATLAMTTIETVKLAGGMSVSYRKWANGLGGKVGDGVRPELTSNQIALMGFDDIEAYRAGLAASVPMVDDPADSIFE